MSTSETITKTAVKVQQGDKTLFVTSFTVGDFMRDNFYTIKKLDTEENKGFQRFLQEERANRFARYMAEAWSHKKEAFLPSSIFLATDKNIAYDEKQHQISFDVSICPFSVVDGQHRIAGLMKAAEKIEALKKFPVPVNIAVNMEDAEQMLHFLVVNTTQKQVDPAVQNRIKARFHEMLGFEKLPYIPSFLKKSIASEENKDAIDIIQFLNSEERSPWYGRIQLADEKKEPKRHMISEKSLSTAIKASVLRTGHPLAIVQHHDRKRILLNYWKAVVEVFATPSDATSDIKDTVVLKTTGAIFFNRLSAAIIFHTHYNKSYAVEDFVEIFKSVQKGLPDELLEIYDTAWWKSGEAASDMNRGATEKKAQEFSRYVTEFSRKQYEDEGEPQ